MGKTSKWIRNFLTGKKEGSKEKINQGECGFTSTIPGTPKEKRRWSFRRSSATGPPPACAFIPKDSSPPPPPPPPPPQQPFVVAITNSEDEKPKNASALASEFPVDVEEVAAVKIQACFRSHLVKTEKQNSVSCFKFSLKESIFYNFLWTGKKSIKSFKRISEITSTRERSPGEETSNGNT